MKTPGIDLIESKPSSTTEIFNHFLDSVYDDDIENY